MICLCRLGSWTYQQTQTAVLVRSSLEPIQPCQNPPIVLFNSTIPQLRARAAFTENVRGIHKTYSANGHQEEKLILRLGLRLAAFRPTLHPATEQRAISSLVSVLWNCIRMKQLPRHTVSSILAACGSH